MIASGLAALFLASAASLILFKAYDHPAVPGYILAGIALGILTEFTGVSLGLGDETLLNLAEIGIAFLLFTFGLKFDRERLKEELAVGLNTSSASVFIVGGLAYLAGFLLGLNAFESAVFSVAAALSSSLVGLQLVDREIQFQLLHGRVSESIHLVQDLIGLAVVVVLFSGSVSASTGSLLAAAFLVAVALGFREFLLDRIAGYADSDELMMLAGLTMLISMITASALLGVPEVIGSFAAGLAAAKFPHNMDLLETLGSLKDFFSAVLFVSLGALAVVPSLHAAAVAFVLLLFTSVVKPLVDFKLLRLQGLDPRTATLSALSLDQVSEIALVVAIQASTVISPGLFQGIVLGGAASMLISSYTGKHSEKIYRVFKSASEPGERVKASDHVILLGYDVQGVRVLEEVRDLAEVVVVEKDPEKAGELEEEGVTVIRGDAMDSSTWRQANASQASLIVSTVPIKSISEKVLGVEGPEKIVRAEETGEARELLEKGALHVSVPDIATTEKLIDHLESLMAKPG